MRVDLKFNKLFETSSISVLYYMQYKPQKPPKAAVF